MKRSFIILSFSICLFNLACTPVQTIEDPPGTTGNATAGTTTSGTTSGSCTPICNGKQCGSDSCGGFCGTCISGKSCSANGQCIGGDCTPQCNNKVCGDDGCGKLCGKCSPGQYCTAEGQCTNGANSCGAIDATGECQNNKTVAVTCKAGKVIALVCNAAKGEVCGFSTLKNKFDCIKPNCTPNCFGKECGFDGCGGLCGKCAPNQICDSFNKCQSGGGCTPNCAGVQCGPDGCGGSCGWCGNGQFCSGNGLCISTNGCTPNCNGKQCGPDGCGASCGTCQFNQQCAANYKCIASGCVPNCTGKQCGYDGCGGSCGLCPGSQDCDGGGHCVSAAGGLCGNVPYEGSCSNNNKTVSWCENGTIKQQDCTAYGPTYICAWVDANEYYWCLSQCEANCLNKECGDNGCGGSCGSCADGKSCNNLGQCKTSGGGGECGNISFEGTCIGNTLKYCSSGTLISSNCGEYGKVCKWDATGNGGSGWFACANSDTGCTPNCIVTVDNQSLPKECGGDGCGNACGVCESNQVCDEGLCINMGSNNCGDVTEYGECEGDILSYCVDGNLAMKDCSLDGQICSTLPDFAEDFYDCVDDPSIDDCGNVTEAGQCDGNVYTYCDNGSLKTQNCAAAGQTCGYQQAISSDGCSGTSTGGGECGNKVPAKGLCIGNTWVACMSGAIKKFNCWEMGLYCMYESTLSKYQCLANTGCEISCPSNQRCQEDGTCGCDGISSSGVCEDETLVYCLGDKLTIIGCPSSGKTCEVSNSGFANCESPPDPCNGIPISGQCNGNTLSSCVNNQVVTKNCGILGQICASMPPPFAGYACIDDPNADNCGGITAEGTCDGEVLTWCDAGQLQSENCAANGEVCEYDDFLGLFECAEADVDGVLCGNKVPVTGLCIGNTYAACNFNGTVGKFNCSELGLYCMYNPDNSKYECLTDQGCENSCPADQRCMKGGGCGCDGITTYGLCEDDNLVWCNGVTLVFQDCLTSGQTCEVDASNYADCEQF
ncbi:MAG TPA: hypothetical protein EYN66_06895 [Myxococcales bacterium]|nr:hypothetical protein [Myxococcales bacterium]